MARRKKTRLTLKKKNTKKADVKTPDGLSAQEFAALAHGYGLFITEDSNHESLAFATGDIAYIQHQDLEDGVVVPEKDYWIGQIQDIRGNDPTDVWVRVQWFWSPQEVAEVIKSFDPSICGTYEKLSSDNVDIISVHCFVSRVNVKTFDETDIHQDFIGDDDWFARFNFLYNAIRISPKVVHAACRICKVPYSPGRLEKVHHFCPRPGCRAWYHQSCLAKDGYVEQTRSHRVLETWPEIDRTVTVEMLCDLHHPRKRQRRNDSTSRRAEPDPLEGFPAKLVAVAEQQIVRGTPEGGIVGNITTVAAARQLIYETLKGGAAMPDDWETTIDVFPALSEADSTHPNFICPSCLSPI